MAWPICPSRTCGFAPPVSARTPGPLATKRYLSAISGFHNLGKPVVADCLGGLVGMAALAFGAISGIALGIGERERFDAADWNKEPKPVDGETRFGRAVRVTIPGLYRSVTLKELDLLVSARGGRRIVTCGDRTCCPHGHRDMTNDPRGHMARQLFRSVSALEEIPDSRREKYFINEPLAHADRRAREIKAPRPLQAEAARIGVDANDLMRRMGEHSHRIEKLRASFEHLHETRGDERPRARPIEIGKDRDGSKSAQAQL